MIIRKVDAFYVILNVFGVSFREILKVILDIEY